MISTKCKSHNLLNHINQKNIPFNLNYEFCNEKGNVNYLKWIGTFEFEGNIYRGSGTNKKDAITHFMQDAEASIYRKLKMKN